MSFPRRRDAELIAQDLVQQGAINAISFLLRNGMSETHAVQSLASMRRMAQLIREEARRRGKSLFDVDQTGFS